MGALWFRMSASKYAAAEAACQERHALSSGNLLSVRWNTLRTECAVKVAGATPEWASSEDWVDGAVTVYDEATHPSLAALLRTVLWQPTDLEDLPL